MIKKEKSFPMFRPIIVWICFLMVIASYGSNAQGKEEIELQRTLKQMDAAGKTFRSFKARFSQKKYTAILKEFDAPDTGDFYYVRAKDGSALVRQEVTSPGSTILTVKGKKATFYQPNVKQAQIVNLVGNYDRITEYLGIGIGKSPAKLEGFNISYQGSESINGESCAILQLKPQPRPDKKAPRFISITLWVKNSNGILVQTKFLEPSGDYTLQTFSEEKLNVKIPDSRFEQKLPNDVDIQHL
jgi:outer membrane lipoprotein-sorting protein